MAVHALRQLSLDTVIQECHAESRQERQRESGYCFELFRRALEEGDQAAWAAIAVQYRQLLLNWIYGYRAVTFTPDEAEATAHEALERFWRTLSARAPDITSHFAHVGALLKYLNQCVIATILDQQRRAQRRARLVERLQADAIALQPIASDTDTLERLCRAEQVAQVRQWVQTHVTDPHEQLVLRLSFEQALTPAQIAQQYPQQFADAQAVRRLKERILKRARRGLSAIHDESATDMAVDAEQPR